jgi:hypothetical protein
MHASLLGFGGSLVDTEMPVHVGNLLLLAGRIIRESSTALSTRLAEVVMQLSNQRRLAGLFQSSHIDTAWHWRRWEQT